MVERAQAPTTPDSRRELFLNAVGDVLDGFPTLKICTGYRFNGKPIDLLPIGADAVAACEAQYEEMPGWRESTVGLKRHEELPTSARNYLRRIESLTGVPVAMISTGPDREETILLHHPFH